MDRNGSAATLEIRVLGVSANGIRTSWPSALRAVASEPVMRFSDGRSNRVDPAMVNACHPDHAARYRFASGFVAGKTVLDVGCAFGYGTSLLAERASHVTGIDIYEPAVAYSRERYPQCDFLLGDVVDLTALDRAFDVAVSLEAVEHVREPARFLAALHRVCAPGGTVVVSTPNALVSVHDGVLSDPTHVNEWTPAEFKNLLEEAGLLEIEQYGVHLDPSVGRRNNVRSTLGRADKVGLKRFVPPAVKAKVIAALAPAPGSQVTIGDNIASALGQIAVARVP